MPAFDWRVLISISPLDWASVGAAIFCGAIVGLERQLRGKPVGIRTATLITLGTYVFVGITDTSILGGGDPTRVTGQVITGIGFLGAGVILARDGIVVGVTSAATIWILAALGVSIGLGELNAAIKLSLLTISILWGVELAEERTRALSRGVHSRMEKRRHRSEHHAD